MITENLSTLKIHKLTQEQYDREFEAGRIDPNALYLTPDEEIDLSPYATIEQLNGKADLFHSHIIGEVEGLSEKLDEIDEEISNLAREDHKHVSADITDLQGKLDEKVSKTTTINSKALTGNITLSASDVGAEASGEISKHNTDTTAHNDIRESISTLVGTNEDDKNKSIRDIAIDVLAEQLVDGNAEESINTLEELADWIRQHPEDASAMNSAIQDNADAIKTEEANRKDADDLKVDKYDAVMYESISMGRTYNSDIGENSVALGTFVQAISENSTAFGTNTIAGTRGYYIQSIDTMNSYIYLRKTRLDGKPYMDDSTDYTDITFETPSYANGEYFNIVNGDGTKYICCAKIASVQNNRIKYDGDLGFTEFTSIDNINNIDRYSFSVPSKSHIGSVIIGGAQSFVAGRESRAAGRDSFVAGWDNIAASNYSSVFGAHNIAGYCSFAEGSETKALGWTSHSEGEWSQALGRGAHAENIGTSAKGRGSHSEGIETVATAEGQHAEGRYNLEDKDCKYAHIVGNGEKGARSNAHTLDWDGNAWYAGDVVSGDGSSLSEVAKISKETEESLNDLDENALRMPKILGINDFDGSKSLDGVIIDNIYLFSTAGSAIYFGTKDKTRLQMSIVGGDSRFRYLFVDDSGAPLYYKDVYVSDLGCEYNNANVRVRLEFKYKNVNEIAGTTDLTVKINIGDTYTDVFTVTNVLLERLIKNVGYYGTGVTIVEQASTKYGDEGQVAVSDGKGGVIWSDLELITIADIDAICGQSIEYVSLNEGVF